MRPAPEPAAPAAPGPAPETLADPAPDTGGAPLGLRTKVMLTVMLCLALVVSLGYALAQQAFRDDPAVAVRFLLGALAVFGLFGGLILVVVMRALEPLQRITAAARRLGEGAEDLGLELHTGDELQVLADALNHSAQAIAEARREREDHFRVMVQTEKMAAVGTLTAGVAHEVNNPLAYLITNEELTYEDLGRIEEDPSLSEAARALVRECRESQRLNLEGLRHIQHVVGALRDLSRAPRKARMVVDLAPVAHGAVTLAGDRARKKEVRLGADVAAPLHALAGAQDIGQVLLNLLLNAIDAVPPRGHVHLAAAVEGDQVVVRVRDNGPGIPPEVQGKLFTPFFTTKTDGVGMGLSISQKIVREHHGRLGFVSAPGAGTLFTMRLPLAAAPAEPVRAAPAPAADGSGPPASAG